MKRITQTLLGSLTAATLALSLVTTAAPPPHASPFTLTFEKCVADAAIGLFVGTVDGECGPGTVVYETIVLAPTPAGVRLEGLYHITTATCSFTAHCSGLANTHNSVIVLNGEVIAGSTDFAGARVKVRAELLNGGACSAGTITLTPTE